MGVAWISPPNRTCFVAAQGRCRHSEIAGGHRPCRWPPTTRRQRPPVSSRSLRTQLPPRPSPKSGPPATSTPRPPPPSPSTPAAMVRLCEPGGTHAATAAAVLHSITPAPVFPEAAVLQQQTRLHIDTLGARQLTAATPPHRRASRRLPSEDEPRAAPPALRRRRRRPIPRPSSNHPVGRWLPPDSSRRRRSRCSSSARRARAAIDEAVTLLQPPLPLVGVSIVMERWCQQNDSLVNG